MLYDETEPLTWLVSKSVSFKTTPSLYSSPPTDTDVVGFFFASVCADILCVIVIWWKPSPRHPATGWMHLLETELVT